MNTDTREEQPWLRRLDLATSPGPVDPQLLDEETAALRENWLALGACLQAVDRERPPLALREACRPVVAKRREWWGAMTMAVTLSVVAIWGAWRLSFDEPSTSVHPATTAAHSPLKEMGHPAEPKSPGFSAEVIWDDEWDEKLAATTWSLRQLSEPPNDHDLMIRQLQDQFQELAREFEANSL